MFGILISVDNMPKIAEAEVFDKLAVSDVSLYLNRRVEWYVIRGYVPPRGPLVPVTVLPAYSVAENFDYDPEKIKTDWSQMVRKESP